MCNKKLDDDTKTLLAHLRTDQQWANAALVLARQLRDEPVRDISSQQNFVGAIQQAAEQAREQGGDGIDSISETLQRLARMYETLSIEMAIEATPTNVQFVIEASTEQAMILKENTNKEVSALAGEIIKVIQQAKGLLGHVE